MAGILRYEIPGPGATPVEIDGQMQALAAAKPRALLGVLLVSADQVVSADRMLEEVWGWLQFRGIYVQPSVQPRNADEARPTPH